MSASLNYAGWSFFGFELEWGYVLIVRLYGPVRSGSSAGDEPPEADRPRFAKISFGGLQRARFDNVAHDAVCEGFTIEPGEDGACYRCRMRDGSAIEIVARSCGAVEWSV